MDNQIANFDHRQWAVAQVRPQVEPLIPQGAWPEFEVAMRSAILKEGKLRDAIAQNPNAALLSVVRCAQLGLSLNPADEHYALIPYKGAVQGQVMVRGWIHLARLSGEVEDVGGDVVYQQEIPPQRWEPLMPNGMPNHSPHVFERDTYADADIIGAYAWVKLRGVERAKTAFLGRARIEQLRSMGMGNTPAWKEHYPRMCVVKAVKALFRTGFVPLGTLAKKAIEEDEEGPIALQQEPTKAVQMNPYPMAVPPPSRLPAEWDEGQKANFEALEQDPLPDPETARDIARGALTALTQQLGTTARELGLVTKHLFREDIKIDDMTQQQAEACSDYLRKENSK